MISATNLYWLTATAQAAYANLIDAPEGYSENLKLGVDNKPLMSEAQAVSFSSEWRVINQIPDASHSLWFSNDPMGGGFSATLFQRKTASHDYVLAFRGTMGNDDLLLTDAGDIVIDGVASSQIIDLYNYVMALKTPSTSTYLKARRETAPTASQAAFTALGPIAGMLAANVAGYYWDSGTAYKIVFDSPTLGLGKIQVGNKLTVTGHSLGGHLAGAFTRLFPEFGAEALTINGAGFGFLQKSNVDTFFDLLAGKSTNFEANRATNLYGNKNWNFITQNLLLQQPGAHLPLYIEQPEVWTETAGHGSAQMVRSAAVYDLYVRLDSSLQSADLALMLSQVTSILEASSNQRINTVEQSVDAMRLVFGLTRLAMTAVEDPQTFYLAVSELQNNAVFQAISGKVKLSSGVASSTSARTDIGQFLSRSRRGQVLQSSTSPRSFYQSRFAWPSAKPPHVNDRHSHPPTLFVPHRCNPL